MKRTWWPLALLVMVGLGAAQLSAGEGGARRGGRSVPYTMEQIGERLGADNGLTEEQKKKVEAVNAEFTKKMEEANKKEGVAAAQEEAKKAREAQNRDAAREAYKKLNEALGFNPYEEYKKALAPILNEAQLAKLFPARGGAAGKTEEKK